MPAKRGRSRAKRGNARLLQNLSPLQLEYLLDSTARINIAEGAVRSGKTHSQLIRWLEFVASHDGPFLVSGKTQQTIQRNIITPMQDMFGDHRISYSSSTQEMILAGKTCYVISASDDGAETRIRGLTVQGWLGDEITIHPQSYVHQAIARCSMPGAKMFWTCNPDSPYHYIYTDYILDNPMVRVWHFMLDDNPALDPDYVEGLKHLYSGLFYRRFILGEWCLAEGTVYDMFDEQKHVFVMDKKPDKYFLGIDYGTTNPCVFQLWGKFGSDRFHLFKEYYHDSTKSGTKTDGDYANDLVDFLGNITPSRIWIDPSALSFITELRKKKRLKGVKQADNSVLDGIRTVATLTADGHISYDPSCKHTIQEKGAYVWDEKKQLQGEDAPLKQNDHCMDAERYGIFNEIINGTTKPVSGGMRQTTVKRG